MYNSSSITWKVAFLLPVILRLRLFLSSDLEREGFFEEVFVFFTKAVIQFFSSQVIVSSFLFFQIQLKKNILTLPSHLIKMDLIIFLLSFIRNLRRMFIKSDGIHPFKISSIECVPFHIYVYSCRNL